MNEQPMDIAALIPDGNATEFRGQQRLVVAADSLANSLATLKDHGFDFLVDITCVDYLQYRADSGSLPPGRFGLAYLLANTTTAQRITVRTYLDDQDVPEVESIVSLWEGANWLEREVFDMYGIRFLGHPNLKRILLPDEFTAFRCEKTIRCKVAANATTSP